MQVQALGGRPRGERGVAAPSLFPPGKVEGDAAAAPATYPANGKEVAETANAPYDCGPFSIQRLRSCVSTQPKLQTVSSLASMRLAPAMSPRSTISSP